MISRTQTGFNQFHCIADKCPKSCCEGWQIVIDDDSMEKYQSYEGTFQGRLEKGIDRQEFCFRQNASRCSMLADSGLCDLQSALGESYLCDTCRQYPRHVEDFLDLREYSLSLSCPEVVRMICRPDYSFGLIETEDDLLDDPDEFGDFDPFLFDQLTYAREKMLQVAADDTQSLQTRLDIIASAAYKLQGLYDEGEIFAMADVSYEATSERNWATTADTVSHHRSGCHCTPHYMLQSFDLLLNLEVLETSWTESIRSAISFWNTYLYDIQSDQPREWKKRDTAISPDRELSHIFEKLLQSLLFRYFSGSIYDGQIYARAMIAIMSVRWIIMLHFADPKTSLEKIVYLFFREVAHSDLNLSALITYFEEELP